MMTERHNFAYRAATVRERVKHKRAYKRDMLDKTLATISCESQ